ncbi:hypothetical protein PR202_gb28439 [Eleusine coracana subsp. coracana]|uniref:Bifunctional inhibitor/plant lipid transfer protein/seed storage helical domain-containing protein n=1 Tax=Eleusine coracana subsp. coracana TaxID=191504 RepID=A0AAV5FUE6_ELECO|nr:hypothetical protein QOZ80_6AG0550580 [Eleusine coracana subsp. coracana]GJN39328.1 hypothetical protein PR202_gb28439 [Eleusine coracana subsp. coracana]
MRRSLLILALCLATTASDDDGTAVPSCASKLVPCGAFLNSTSTPPATCCGPLKEAAFNETKCMCAMLLNKAALQAFGVAPDQGMALAKRCGVTVDASVCNKYAAGTGAPGVPTGGAAADSSTSTGNSPSTVTKPTANGGTTLRLNLMLMGAWTSLVFVWWTIMA